jgi:hypothetical protein
MHSTPFKNFSEKKKRKKKKKMFNHLIRFDIQEDLKKETDPEDIKEWIAAIIGVYNNEQMLLEVLDFEIYYGSVDDDERSFFIGCHNINDKRFISRMLNWWNSFCAAQRLRMIDNYAINFLNVNTRFFI